MERNFWKTCKVRVCIVLMLFLGGNRLCSSINLISLIFQKSPSITNAKDNIVPAGNDLRQDAYYQVLTALYRWQSMTKSIDFEE